MDYVALSRRIRTELKLGRPELPQALDPGDLARQRELEGLAPSTLNSERRGDLLEGFLEGDYPAAICHSLALGRDFVLARDEAALEALTEADQRLPVLFFGEAAKLRQMGLEGLRALLDFRAVFGPGVELRSVRGPGA